MIGVVNTKATTIIEDGTEIDIDALFDHIDESAAVDRADKPDEDGNEGKRKTRRVS